MNSNIISGKKIAIDIIENNLIPRVLLLNKKSIQPKLVIILIGDNEASKRYIKQKEIFSNKAGIISEIRNFDENITESKLLDEIKNINNDKTIHGLIVQLPVPKHISVKKILNTISPIKDVDGFTPQNLGNLFLGEETLKCCTPKGIITMLEKSNIEIKGKRAVILGRSNIVGKPVSILLMNKGATVTVCHSNTKNLKEEIARAEILISAIGKPEIIKGEWIPKNCVVIDVGTNIKNGKLCGDIEFEVAKKRVFKISPVPGGVGPMTVVSLIENTIEVAEKL